MEELDFYQLSREKLIEILRSKLKIVAEKTEKGFKFSFVGKDEAKIYARQVSPRVEKFIQFYFIETTSIKKQNLYHRMIDD